MAALAAQPGRSWARAKMALALTAVLVSSLVSSSSAHSRIGFIWDEKEYSLHDGFAREVCYDDGLSATYIIGKAYEMIAGPLPPRIMDKGLPFIQEAQDRGTLWGQRVVDAAICESMLKLLKAKLPGFKVYSRWEQLRECAVDSLGNLGEHNLGIGNLMGKMVTASLASNLAHAYRHDPLLLCQVLAFPAVTEAIEPFLVHGTAVSPSSEEEDGDDDGACEAGESCAAQKIDSVCTLSRWRSCPDAKPHEKELTGMHMNRQISEAVEHGRVVFQEVLYEHFRATVNDAFRWVLGRDVDESGVQRYVPIVAAGKGVEDVSEMLRGSREFEQRCANEGCLEYAMEEVNDVFREVLLRDADEGAKRAYGLLLQNKGSRMEVVNVLLLSSEYQELCTGRVVSCPQGKAMVKEAFRAILGRDPDVHALISYTREIVVGNMNLPRLMSSLRSSDEYIDRTDPRHRAQDVVEKVKRMFKECGDSQAHLSHEEFRLPVSKNFGKPAWIGRWCQRGKCSGEANSHCGLWPLKAYKLVMAILYGRAPEEDMMVGEAAMTTLLPQYDAALDAVILAYINVMGRFPDLAGVNLQVPRLVSGSIVASQLAHWLKDSEELQERKRKTAEELHKAASGISTLARVFKDFSVAVPEEAQGCLTEGWFSAGLPNQGKLLVCRDLSETSEDKEECLGGDLSDFHCKPQQRLCSASLQPLPPAAEQTLRTMKQWWKDKVYEMQPRTVVDVYGTSPNGKCTIGWVLKTLQDAWNERGPLLGARRVAEKDRAPPIALYVHERPHYFKQVVGALSKVRGIKNSLIIVSLDSVNEAQLALALSVDFAPLRILFHPGREDLVRPDGVLAVKQHWWWLQEMVWENLEQTRGMTGHLALLEEDHVVSTDYLELLAHLIDLQRKECSYCWGVTVRWACTQVQDTDTKKICKSHHIINTGIAFNRDTFEQIKESDFERFPDGWDWSLFHLAQTGQMNDMMLGPAVSRIRNIGTEGVTVSEDGGDAHLQEQLQYEMVDTKIKKSAYKLDPSEDTYTPPGWEPLFLGNLGFVAALS
mmetsp:Transcript_41434/g.84710  ORF Transcript_41434/g.84710 Transcript_41434/m.84710 type:complete len:1046 (-) Transcript_41434:18-3155(-)